MLDKIFKRIIDVLLIIIIAITCVYFGSGIINKDMTKASVFGYKLIYVASGSMEPTIMTGEIIICRIIDADDVEIGDICTYVLNGKTIVHRVVDITTEGNFIFKGDNNREPDIYPVKAKQIRAKVI